MISEHRASAADLRPSFVQLLVALGGTFSPEQVRVPLDYHAHCGDRLIEVTVSPSKYDEALDITSDMVLSIEKHFGDHYSIVVVPISASDE
jgi:hypothetical protein